MLNGKWLNRFLWNWWTSNSEILLLSKQKDFGPNILTNQINFFGCFCRSCYPWNKFFNCQKPKEAVILNWFIVCILKLKFKKVVDHNRHASGSVYTTFHSSVQAGLLTTKTKTHCCCLLGHRDFIFKPVFVQFSLHKLEQLYL